MKTYSVVIPLYKAEVYLPALLEALESLNQRLNGELEAVLVLDGLADNSLSILQTSLPSKPFSSLLIRHSRNFGSLAAIRTGLSRATGQYFATLSADLQEPPELALSFFESLSQDRADVVVGQRISRADPLFSRWMASLYWAFYRRFVQPEVPKGGVDTFGCNRVFRTHLLDLHESHNVLIGSLFWLGFRREIVSYVRQPSRRGKSTWSFQRKLRYALDTILLFSDFPIRLMMYLGWLALGAALCLGLLAPLGLLQPVPALSNHLGSLLMALGIIGINAVGLGVLGGYAWRILETTRQWPQAVIMDERSYPGKS
jgi:glycosyltransferase involved in cell wall biosynthesis